MKRARTIAAAALGLALAASALAVAPVGAKAPTYDVKHESFGVKTKYGNIYVEVDRPVDPTDPKKVVKGPAILTYSPYSILWLGLCQQRACDVDRWVPHGYVRVWADVVGTGNSGGCWDYGGIREKVTGYDVVEWIAKQPWSDGKVAMIGGSYEGTTAWATAVMKPPHLTTIVPEAAIARWYDYAYSGGIRYNDNNEIFREGPGAPTDEGIDTPLGFDFGLAIPPPLDPQDPGWGQKVKEHMTPCQQLEHTQHGYSQTPDYGKFWQERDYLRDAAKIRIPALIAANWGDWNVKQEESILMYHALRNSPNVKLYMGNAFTGHGTPAGAYDKTVDAWMAHYLLGANNGVQNMPAVHSQETNYDSTTDKAGPWYAGPWPHTTKVVLYAQQTPVTNPNDYQWKLLPTKPKPGKETLGPPVPGSSSRFPSAGVNTESHAAHHARNNHDWFWFETPPLKRNVRVFGPVQVQVYFRTSRTWVTLTPSILDFNHASHKMIAGQHVGTDPRALTAVTRGWLDSRYARGLGKPISHAANKPYLLHVTAKPTDYTFLKGDSFGVSVQTEIDEWSIPKPYPCNGPDCVYIKIDWRNAKTRLVVPVVGTVRNPMSLFDLSGGF